MFMSKALFCCTSILFFKELMTKFYKGKVIKDSQILFASGEAKSIGTFLFSALLPLIAELCFTIKGPAWLFAEMKKGIYVDV